VAEIAVVAGLLTACRNQRRKLAVCGNGGSAATASHIVADLAKCLHLETGLGINAVCITDSIPLLTAWSNDDSYEMALADEVERQLSAGDYLMVISGSGNSPNVCRAVEAANKIGATTIALVGFDGGKVIGRAQHVIYVDAHDMQLAEDAHMAICHMLYRAVKGASKA
jgi:D-sedoheptulose 7-phosphate isomerase